MTAREPPQPCLRSGGHAVVKPCREGARRHRRAAVPWVREDRVARLPREHGTVTRRDHDESKCGVFRSPP
jgi:hypothetical protein